MNHPKLDYHPYSTQILKKSVSTAKNTDYRFPNARETLDYHSFGVQSLDKSASKHDIMNDTELWASIMPILNTDDFGIAALYATNQKDNQLESSR